MSKYIKILILTAWGSLATSCMSYYTYTSFEQLQPAEFSFPKEIHSVAIFNNVPYTPTVLEGRVIYPQMEGNGYEAVQTLAKEIANTEFFDTVVLCDSLSVAADTLKKGDLLPQSVIHTLCLEHGADMLISLDRVMLESKDKPLVFDGYILEGIQTYVTPLVRIYTPSRSKPMTAVAMTDSIEWVKENTLEPNKMLTEASQFAGTVPVKHLIPYWEKREQMYYVGNCVEMRDAVQLVDNSLWDEAAALWQQAYKTKKGKVKAQAAYNMAIYSEVTDQSAESIDWIDKAITLFKPETDDHKAALLYKLKLEERASKLGKLQLQMQRMNN